MSNEHLVQLDMGLQNDEDLSDTQSECLLNVAAEVGYRGLLREYRAVFTRI